MVLWYCFGFGFLYVALSFWFLWCLLVYVLGFVCDFVVFSGFDARFCVLLLDSVVV